eukprot:sb/3463899/
MCLSFNIYLSRYTNQNNGSYLGLYTCFMMPHEEAPISRYISFLLCMSVRSRKNSFCSADILVGMGDPLTKLSIELPQILHNRYTSRAYNRTAYWEFEDIQMLLGNNLPIFGGGEYPAISLKLRDMKEPINVLTGIDCWLDNLICNVPELAMCWHLDGLVQGYDLFKTEEIPELSDSRFDPVVIKDLASNVLKFLKAHCVKEGHTYWLYRAKGDDIVKLYDLSSICVGINQMNPFSTPVALLCFKVAQRLYEEDVEKERSTIYTLLQNCLQLIPNGVYPQSRKNSFCSADILVGMGDPLTKLSIELPQILHNRYTSRAYNRTAYWEFEDIQMLLGNNLPIFGGGEYPAISLKLRDMKEPINVLTGIDCWLDNLICNVPELAMCWHLDGLVQGYDLFKTEEIPELSDSRFDPVVIKDLASNVLKFLKAHCVKEGHTYWLYRAKGDDIVKLYDLSSICVGINQMNPFSTPVALLCFKVAQRLYEEDVEKERSTIYTLLQNCLQLIPNGVYPQVGTILM